MSHNSCVKNTGPIPNLGVGLRYIHYKQFMQSAPALEWLEVHPENFFGFGAELEVLEALSEKYKISFHGVGLSLGSSEGLDILHLKKLKSLIERFKPSIFSEHIAWSRSGNAHFHDLLPIPYTDESLRHIADNINRTQDFLGRVLVVENPSVYVELKHQYSEPEFINKLMEKTRCRLLLDINNVFVSSYNTGADPYSYLDAIRTPDITEIHLAGHIRKEVNGEILCIDTHNRPVSEEVWELYGHLRARPDLTAFTMLEWDADYPPYEVLLAEAIKTIDIAQNIRRKYA